MKRNDRFLDPVVNGTYKLRPVVIPRHRNLSRWLWPFVFTLAQGHEYAESLDDPLTEEEEAQEWAD
jgi:hypothetical protein